MAELKVGDEIKLSESHPRHPGKKGKVVQVFPTGFVKVRLESGEADVELKSNIAANALNAVAKNGRDDAILRLCKPKNIIEKGKTENLHEVRYGGGYIYPLVGHDGVLLKVYGSLSDAHKRARNAAGYVDASSVVLQPGDAVVFKAGYRSHKDDDEWLERNGDTVREVRGDEVKLGPSANDWAKIKDLMVWHNSRSTNAVVVKALNASRVPLDAEKAMNAVGRDKQDAASVEMWIGLFNNFLDWSLKKHGDPAKARKNGETILKNIEDSLDSDGGREQLKKMGWTMQKLRDALEKGLRERFVQNSVRTTNPIVRKALNSVAANAQFKVGDIVEAMRPQVHKLGVKGTVTRVKPDTIIVKWHDDGFEAQYGIEGNFKSATPKQVVAPEQKLREELMRSGYGRDRDSAMGWLTAHRRGLAAKYGRDIYEKVRSETARNATADPLTGTEVDVSRSVSVLNACAATNREFKPGDKVCIGGRAGRERGETVETIERVEGEGREKMLFFKGSKWGVPARMYAYANAEAVCNERYLVQTLEGDRWETKKTTPSRMDADSYMRVYQRSYSLSDVRILRASDGAEIARG